MNSSHNKSISILFIEDDEIGRSLMLRLLKRRFQHVLVAQNGIRGWDLFQEHRPKIVITDLNLPDISGLELIKRIRLVDSNCAVMIISAYDETEYLTQAIELGVTNFLVKPIDMKKLDLELEKIIRQTDAEREIERQRHYARTVLDLQDSLVLITDGIRIVDANQQFWKEFLLKEEELENRTLEAIFRNQEGMPSLHEFAEEDWTQQSKEVEKVTLLLPRNGKKRYFNMKIARFPHEPDLKIVSLTDVTALEHERQYYQEMAVIDPLTGIYNRIQFNRSLQEEIQKSKRFQSEFAVIMFDIDHFKIINDTFGHQLGDTILIELTEMVKNNIREVDIFARYGGEEFILLAPETDISGAAVLAEKLRIAIESGQYSHGNTLTCSFGVTEFKENDQPDDLIKRVDDRLYLAKKKGRNQVCSST